MKKGICTTCGKEAGYNNLMCSDCLRDFDFSEYKVEVDYASFDCDDDKVRIYSDRVAEELYAALATKGFRRAYRQGCFFATWSPIREDAALALCDEIVDEDTTLAERAEDRSARFATYAGNAQQRARAAKSASDEISKYIPLGQPILVGHHSEKRHRRDLAKMQRLATKTVEEFDRGEYWQRRAAGVSCNAERKYRPQTVINRIKKLEARRRKLTKESKLSEMFLALWAAPGLDYEGARRITNRGDHGVSAKFPLDKYPREEHIYEGSRSLWSALTDGIIDHEQAKAIAIPCHWRTVEWNTRWIEHLTSQIEYWKLFLEDEHGENIDEQKPIKKGQWVMVMYGGPVWAQVVRVNKSRETKRITTVSIDKETAKGRRYWARKWAYEQIVTIQDDEPTEAQVLGEVPAQPAPKRPEPDPEREAAKVAQDVAKNTKIETVYAPDFFPTPMDLVRRMIENAKIGVDLVDGLDSIKMRVLEPSAGTGNILNQIRKHQWASIIDWCEIDCKLREHLENHGNAIFYGSATAHDFTKYDPGPIYDRIIMNPPFSKRQDVRHVLRAWRFLKPGGRLVAVMSEGAFFRNGEINDVFRMLLHEHGKSEVLPEGTFKSEGTMVRTRLVVMDKPAG